jgi:hypothetical protein
MKNIKTFEIFSTNNKVKKINEIGPKLASKTLSYLPDLRKAKLSKDAITSMFSEYIGKNKPFFIKINKKDNPVKYQLIEVSINLQKNIVDFDFYNEMGVEDDAPYASNKKEITLEYNIEEDKFDLKYGNIGMYHFNMFMAKFLVKAANLIREMYYTWKPKQITQDGEYIPDPNFTMISNVTKNSFKLFSYDSKNLLNKGVNEISSSLRNRTISKMKQKGMEKRADKWTQFYIDKDLADFKGKQIKEDYIIYSFKLEYKTGKENKTETILKIYYGNSNTHIPPIEYNLTTDDYKLPYLEIDRKTARILSKIATRLNPESKYSKPVTDNFKIKDY